MATTRVLTAHVPTELAEKVDEWAAHNDRPRGWVMKEALINWIDREERRHQMTLDALADVDAGRTVPHSEIIAWIDSLPDGPEEPI